jgi:hypothetical protein
MRETGRSVAAAGEERSAPARPERGFWSRAFFLLALVHAIAFYVVGARLKPGYSHTANFLSELNATGTPWARELGLYGFLPLGLLVAAFLVAAWSPALRAGASPVALLLLFSQPIAYLGVAFAPCDAGCPASGSASQAAHNLIALVTYFAAGAGFFALSRATALRGTPFRPLLVGAGVAWLALFVLMLQPALAPWRGLLQRLAEAILFGVFAVLAWRVVPNREG